MTGTTPRRQARGLRRMEEILDAAEAIGAQDGFDAMTTSHLASSAGVSPGSLYQYFDNKEAIITALVERHLGLLDQARFDLADPALAELSPADAAARTVGPLIAHHRAHPGLRALMALQTSPAYAPLVAPLHARLCDDVDHLIALRAPGSGAHQRRGAATVTIQIFAGLLPVVLDAPTRERKLLVTELERALAAYWAALTLP